MITDSISRIREHLQQPGITKRDLAAKAGLHANTLIGIEDDSWNPSANTLKALEEAMYRPTPRDESRAA